MCNSDEKKSELWDINSELQGEKSTLWDNKLQ